MKDRIIDMLYNKTDEIFVEIQDEKGITDGDSDPLMVCEFDEKLKELAGIMERILNFQNLLLHDKEKE